MLRPRGGEPPMFMIAKLQANRYERIAGTPLFDDAERAEEFAREYMEIHASEFPKGTEPAQVQPALKLD